MTVQFKAGRRKAQSQADFFPVKGKAPDLKLQCIPGFVS